MILASYNNYGKCSVFLSFRKLNEKKPYLVEIVENEEVTLTSWEYTEYAEAVANFRALVERHLPSA